MDMENDINEELSRLEIELVSPETRANVGRLAELIHDRFEEIGASGRIYNKDELLESLPKQPGPTYELSSFRFEEIGEDHVLLKYESRVAGKRALRSSIWVKESGSWKLLHHQATVVPDGA